LPSILAEGRRIERFGLYADAIVDCKPDPLIRAQVALRCLNGNMTQQHLNLLQFSSRCLADLRQALSCEWRRIGTDSIPAWSLTTERYLGCKQNLEKPVNDRFGCLFARTSVDLR
jgi:hypothetical protein